MSEPGGPFLTDELLTGDLPFKGSLASVMSQILSNPPPPPSLLRPDLQPALEAICLKMMAKSVEDRYASMREVADDLGEYLRQGRHGGAAAGDSARLPAFEQTDGDRPAGIAGLRSRLHEQQQRAEALLRLGRYDVALRIVESMLTVTEPTLAAYTRWAERELPRVREAQAAAVERDTDDGSPAEGQWASADAHRRTRRRVVVPAAAGAVALCLWAGTALWNRAAEPRNEAGARGVTSTDHSRGGVGAPATLNASREHDPAPDAAADQPAGKSADPGELLRIAAPDKLLSVAITPDGRAAVAACADGHVHEWDIDSGQPLHRLDPGGDGVRLVTTSADGSRFAAAAGRSIRVWNADGSRAGEVPTDDPVVAFGLSPDGRQVFAAFNAFGPGRLRPGRPLIDFGPVGPPFADRYAVQAFEVATGRRVYGMTSPSRCDKPDARHRWPSSRATATTSARSPLCLAGGWPSRRAPTRRCRSGSCPGSSAFRLR